MATVGARSTPEGRPRSVRLRAVLATGLVLGTGATMTLAQWTDQTLPRGEFSASSFAVQANASTPYDPGAPWAQHTDDAAVLQLDAGDMTPGSRKHAALALRTTPDSLGGTALLGPGEIVAGSDTGLAGALRYRVVASALCDSSVFAPNATYVVGGPEASAPLTTGQAPEAPLTLPAAAPDAPGQPLHLCVEVLLPVGANNALQGAQMEARWRITSQSQTP